MIPEPGATVRCEVTPDHDPHLLLMRVTTGEVRPILCTGASERVVTPTGVEFTRLPDGRSMYSGPLLFRGDAPAVDRRRAVVRALLRLNPANFLTPGQRQAIDTMRRSRRRGHSGSKDRADG